MKIFETIVIGAGQAGLAAGYYLKKEGIDFVILERNDVGGSWNEYYDSLQLFTPKEVSALPGLTFPGNKNEYPTRAEMAAYLKQYAVAMQLPIETDVEVQEVLKEGGVFVLTTSSGEYRAKTVVVASGPFNEPFIPSIEGSELFTGTVLHTHEYKNPESFVGKRVVVVGSGASAVQIAVELAEVANVILAVRSKPRFWPRTLFGKDITFWGRYTIDLFTLPMKGSIVIDTQDKKYERLLRVQKPSQRNMFTEFYEDGVLWPGGEKEPVDVVIFGTGYKSQFRFLNRVSKNEPGLFFLGMPNLRNYASATVRGAGRDGRVIVRQLKRYLQKT